MFVPIFSIYKARIRDGKIKKQQQQPTTLCRIQFGAEFHTNNNTITCVFTAECKSRNIYKSELSLYGAKVYALYRLHNGIEKSFRLP